MKLITKIVGEKTKLNEPYLNSRVKRIVAPRLVVVHACLRVHGCTNFCTRPQAFMKLQIVKIKQCAPTIVRCYRLTVKFLCSGPLSIILMHLFTLLDWRGEIYGAAGKGPRVIIRIFSTNLHTSLRA